MGNRETDWLVRADDVVKRWFWDLYWYEQPCDVCGREGLKIHTGDVMQGEGIPLRRDIDPEQMHPTKAVHLCDECFYELRKRAYREIYLKSDYWKKISTEAKERAGYKCQACSSTVNLQAHHNTYDHLGCELPEDVICLCEKCHAIFFREGKLAR